MHEAINRLIGHVVNSGIRHVIICPGSRNAPLTLAFSRHPQMQCYALVDERSAAFTAVGMAVAIGKPVVVLCTSGTAVLNVYPAIAEAYYSQIPLLIITADRPPELIDQWDGQCIRQTNIFEKHILASFTYDPLHANDEIVKAITLCSYPVQGPVHINVPLCEPLYEGRSNNFDRSKETQVILPNKKNNSHFPKPFNYSKILILAGADAFGKCHKEGFKAVLEQGKMVLIADIISGLHDVQSLYNWDLLLTVADEELKCALQPELLISIGKFTVSKGLKNFIKDYKPVEHWHITDNHTIANPFQTDVKEIEANASDFLKWIFMQSIDFDQPYYEAWTLASTTLNDKLESLIQQASFNEFTAVNYILSNLPKYTKLHVGNSMPIRYVSFLANKLNDISVYCNRGTSGIDGCLSTAVGASLMQNELSVMLLGDLSFFYDINALWNPYIKPNLKIMVINNKGGGIFRMIDGSKDLPERERYFATASTRNCERLAEEFNFGYFKAMDFVTLQSGLSALINDITKPGILEIDVDSDNMDAFYKNLKAIII